MLSALTVVGLGRNITGTQSRHLNFFEVNMDIWWTVVYIWMAYMVIDLIWEGIKLFR